MVSIIDISSDALSLSDYTGVLTNGSLEASASPLHIDDIFMETSRYHSVKLKNDYPLHLAAKNGDMMTILNLYLQGYDINQANSRSMKPIDIAALYGKTDIVEMLINLGANTDDNAYQDHTALQFALLSGNYDTAAVLLTEGYADPNHYNLAGENSFNITINQLDNFIQFYNSNPLPSEAENINNNLNIIELLAYYAEQPALYNDVIWVHSEDVLMGTPVSVILNLLSTAVSSESLRSNLTSAAATVEEIFPSAQTYINAKNLLVAFPTGQDYEIDLSGVNTWIGSDGHYGLYTTQLATHSLGLFIGNLQERNADPIMVDVFNALYSTFQFSSNLIAKSGQFEASAAALTYYNEGKTLLIPSGWDWHFIDVILSKQQGWYMTANSGDRYYGESPDLVPDPAGVIIYQMTDPRLIDAEFIFDALNNADKMILEIIEPYDYDIFGMIDNIVCPEQVYGNCAWESHRDAVQGLAYVELVNRGFAQAIAKSEAKAYFQEWDNFHGNFIIEQYMSYDPILPVQALIDIIQNIQQNPDFTSRDQIHGQKIADALISPIYLDAFMQWLQTEDQEPVAEFMNTLHDQYGIEVSSSLQGSLNEGQMPAFMPHVDNFLAMVEQPQFIAA